MYATTYVSPLGPIAIGATDRGVSRCHFVVARGKIDTTSGTRVDGEGTDILCAAQQYAAATVDQLAEYFAGTRMRFTLPLDLAPCTDFQRQVLDSVAVIPYGCVVTYKDLATHIGRPRAYRAAANACRINPVAIIVPCHRVIAGDGGLGGYYGAAQFQDVKRALLRHEGHTVDGPRRVVRR